MAALRELGEWDSQVKSREGWEIGREVNPLHQIFWVDMAFFLGLALCATWQTWDYAMFKARAGNKGYLFSGAHHLWRIAGTIVLSLILLFSEFVWGHHMMHFVAALAMLFDATVLYVHVEKSPMPVLFPLLEAILTTILAFGLSDKGRLTAPIVLMIASFRFAAEFWPLKTDEDCFKIVSAVLLAALAWHWFPLIEAINLWNVEKAEQDTKHDNEFNNYVDMLFCFNLLLGHLTILGILWKILPQFFSNELAYERQGDGGPSQTKAVEVGAW